jgi:hypothetical protein
MFKVHGYRDDKLVLKKRMEHIPHNGDTVRFADEQYARVTEIIWCMDEKSEDGQRVNIRMESMEAMKEPS